MLLRTQYQDSEIWIETHIFSSRIASPSEALIISGGILAIAFLYMLIELR
ncbi:MAG: hypothetical protein RLZZ139_1015 [Cyanobacteriota bacterium]|jgi:hypothetical protein